MVGITVVYHDFLGMVTPCGMYKYQVVYNGRVYHGIPHGVDITHGMNYHGKPWFFGYGNTMWYVQIPGGVPW